MAATCHLIVTLVSHSQLIQNLIDDKLLLLLPFVLCVATCSVFVGVNSCCVTMDNTSFARLAGLCKAMDDHSKGIVGDLQAKLDFEEKFRRDTFEKYGRTRHIAKLLLHKNDASMDYTWKNGCQDGQSKNRG